MIAGTSGIYSGLSTEEKPSPDLPAAIFLETDTQKHFTWNGSVWTEFTGAIPVWSYTPGSVTVVTGNFMIIVKRLQLTGSQRLTLQGTSRLRGV